MKNKCLPVIGLNPFSASVPLLQGQSFAHLCNTKYTIVYLTNNMLQSSNCRRNNRDENCRVSEKDVDKKTFEETKGVDNFIFVNFFHIIEFDEEMFSE